MKREKIQMEKSVKKIPLWNPKWTYSFKGNDLENTIKINLKYVIFLCMPLFIQINKNQKAAIIGRLERLRDLQRIFALYSMKAK